MTLRINSTRVAAAVFALVFPIVSLAGEADVLKAVATPSGADQFRFDVTIRSQDKDWDYYCDRFEIVGPDGAILGTRVLHHPHETEQPFTRSLRQVKIDAAITSVIVRAKMKPSGAGGDEITLTLPGR